MPPFAAKHGIEVKALVFHGEMSMLLPLRWFSPQVSRLDGLRSLDASQVSHCKKDEVLIERFGKHSPGLGGSFGARQP